MDEEITELEKSGATETAAKLREKWKAHATAHDTLKAEHADAAKKLTAAEKDLAKYKADLEAKGKCTDERVTKLSKERDDFKMVANVRAASSKRAERLSRSNVSPAGNGATNYGELKARTILAMDSNGLLHPIGVAKVDAIVSAANNVVVDIANGFRVGDLVSVRSGTSKTRSITNNGVALSIVAKVQGLNLILAVAGNSTPFSSSYNPVNKTITLALATDGGGVARD